MRLPASALLLVGALVLSPFLHAAGGQIRVRFLENLGAQSGLTAGDVVIRFSGTCGAGFTEVAAADGKFLRGTVAANADVGDTGGSDTATPSAHTGTDVSAHSGAAVGDHAAHTHSVTSNVTVADHASHTHDYTTVLNHTHTVSVTDPGHTHVENNNSASTGGLTGWGAPDTSTNTSQATGYSTASATTGITASTANPGGGAATGTTAGPSAALSHTPTNNAVTSGNPSATLTHSVTQPSAHTITQPAAHSAISVTPAFKKAIFCEKT